MKKKNIIPQKELPTGEVNIIPIVDVSFCLVIFCLVTMNIMLTAGINVTESGTGAAKGRTTVKENVAITLTKDNRIMVDNTEIPKEELGPRLARLLPGTKDRAVIVGADDTATCECVVEILDIAKKSGAQRLVLLENVGNNEEL